MRQVGRNEAQKVSPVLYILDSLFKWKPMQDFAHIERYRKKDTQTKTDRAVCSVMFVGKKRIEQEL